MQTQRYKQQLQAAADQLRDPFRFRIFVALVSLAVAYGGVYVPLGGQIDEAKRKLKRAEETESLTQDIDLLHSQMELFEGRLVEDSDVNEWIEYVLNGVRALPLKLINLDSGDERKVGLYRAVTLQLSVSGEIKDLDALLHWLETNDRLIRVDVMNLDPAREQEAHRIMQLTILGLKG